MDVLFNTDKRMKLLADSVSFKHNRANFDDPISP